MFLTASKLLGWVADPRAWALGLIVVALLVGRRHAAMARAIAGVTLGVLLLFSTPAVVNSLQRWTESSAARTFRTVARYDVVIVLGGTGDRLGTGMEVLRVGGATKLLYSEAITTHELDTIRQQLRGWGIEEHALVLESSSRNTRENALEAARAVAAHGWSSILLVTSATHVPRALGCFRRAGLSPDVLPVTAPPITTRSPWLPDHRALERARVLLHEAVGRLVYRLAGYVQP